MSALDALLSEFEAAGAVSGCSEVARPRGSSQAGAVSGDCERQQLKQRSAIDDLLHEFSSAQEPAADAGSPAAASLAPQPSLKRTARCTSVCLGGEAELHGLNLGDDRVCCDRLRCTKCDLDIVSFSNREWLGADYLFVRTNHPDEAKLGARMVRRPGTRAYACQCSWASATALRCLTFDSELRWRCSGHP